MRQQDTCPAETDRAVYSKFGGRGETMGRSLTGRERKCIPGGDGKGKNPNPKSQARHSGDCEEGRTAWKEGRICGGEWARGKAREPHWN